MKFSKNFLLRYFREGNDFFAVGETFEDSDLTGFNGKCFAQKGDESLVGFVVKRRGLDFDFDGVAVHSCNEILFGVGNDVEFERAGVHNYFLDKDSNILQNCDLYLWEIVLNCVVGARWIFPR